MRSHGCKIGVKGKFDIQPVQTSMVTLVNYMWEGNRQEGQGSRNGGNSLQVSDIFISLKRQEETN